MYSEGLNHFCCKDSVIYTFPIKMIVVSTVFRRDTKNCNNASISAAVVFLVHSMPEKFENATNNGHVGFVFQERNGCD